MSGPVPSPSMKGMIGRSGTLSLPLLSVMGSPRTAGAVAVAVILAGSNGGAGSVCVESPTITERREGVNVLRAAARISKRTTKDTKGKKDTKKKELGSRLPFLVFHSIQAF